MEIKVLAICDTEKQYALKLMEAFCEKKNLGFQVHAFSTVEDLEQFALRTRIEILLIPGKNMSKNLNTYDIGKIILLSDGEFCEEFSDYESIYKYQSADHIMKEVLCYYAEYARPVAGMYYGKKEVEIYGVYSPIGRCGKTALAEGLAECLGKKKKTLLLDLQSYSARKEQLSHEELWDLADMIYFLRQGKQTFLYKLGSIVKSKETFDYILPMKAPADLRSVTLSEWIELLEKLATDSDYHVVVIDFGYEICGLFQLLSQCSRIYMPILSDEDSQKKLENFEWIVRDENFEKMMNNIQKIHLPEYIDSRNVKLFMREWAERSVTS